MKEQKVTFSFILTLGFMLFALFFGAGNLIFPAMLGQLSGDHVWWANGGFLVTGVGLPLLGVLAFGMSGKTSALELTQRVHPVFGLIFTTVLYLSIGPLFAMPRTGSTSYEIAVTPFLSDGSHPWVLFMFTILYFGVTCFLALKPAKIVDIVGKYLTPFLLVFLGVLIVTVFVQPLGSFQEPSEQYAVHPFSEGFQQGYLTMDILASLVFGIIVIQAIQAKGVTSRKKLLGAAASAAIIAAVFLAIIYTSISYTGATSVSTLGLLDNGGTVLALVANSYYGAAGNILLGLIVTLACLTTSIGLTTACAAYFSKLMPNVSYSVIAIILSVFSAVFANIGLSELISISVPVLSTIYPLAIVIILLTFLHRLFGGRAAVYQMSLLLTLVISLFDGLKAAGIEIPVVTNVFKQILPLYAQGLGWLVPALVGAVLGYLCSYLFGKGKKYAT
ncbi:branched-chain amino acid transport system II carrier protein [Aureibacillus halotolerans]|uniref:Branched-chain amino acid transport system carrier protein n=1 Tax=Aureibacillus halotolerans TaxID=1508390 RepID=A0A4R6U3D2_9BACI|nr:branched-chain amino acid transport system II carrier protein [Aureibacillus halotolerans]TDQ40900.1 LIVCS family branched-chain amino acid:cation transporter [Aureibacillus halotolerans]